MHPKLTLLILCALSASALNALAENKVVTTGTVTEADQTYEAVSGTAALYVTGSESSYSGTNLTLSGIAELNNGRNGALVANQGRLDLHDTTSSGGAVPYGYAAYATGSSVMTISGGTFTTTGTYGNGVYYSGSSTGRVENVSISTTELAAYGL
ncbi:MAG: hypothetical protein LBK71_11770, partial [Verrucomicrobiales bacterium]|nr:hypothetical protein [Verrucomicrobiales bacterium]